MTGFHLTPEMIEGSYIYLRVSPPFNRWGLPEPDDLAFKVASTRNCSGWFRTAPGAVDEIAISRRCVSSPAALLPVMAHEMIHLYQHRRGIVSRRAEHNADFHRRARLVCKSLTFDYAAFV